MSRRRRARSGRDRARVRAARTSRRAARGGARSSRTRPPPRRSPRRPRPPSSARSPRAGRRRGRGRTAAGSTHFACSMTPSPGAPAAVNSRLSAVGPGPLEDLPLRGVAVDRPMPSILQLLHRLEVQLDDGRRSVLAEQPRQRLPDRAVAHHDRAVGVLVRRAASAAASLRGGRAPTSIARGDPGGRRAPGSA